MSEFLKGSDYFGSCLERFTNLYIGCDPIVKLRENSRNVCIFHLRPDIMRSGISHLSMPSQITTYWTNFHSPANTNSWQQTRGPLVSWVKSQYSWRLKCVCVCVASALPSCTTALSSSLSCTTALLSCLIMNRCVCLLYQPLTMSLIWLLKQKHATASIKTTMATNGKSEQLISRQCYASSPLMTVRAYGSMTLSNVHDKEKNL